MISTLDPSLSQIEQTTVWSFPERGAWATHRSTYPGNWAPQVPRNIILRYTSEGETVLDPMMGAGTTLIEAKLLNRHVIGNDINPDAVNITKKNLEFNCHTQSRVAVTCGDALALTNISTETIDVVLTHPPYMNIIKYSNGQILGDLSSISTMSGFLGSISQFAAECFRVLRKGRHCAILIGDTRRRGQYIPLAYNVMLKFIDAGFSLKEDIIKLQHNCRSTGRWSKILPCRNHLLIMHEHLFVFQKTAVELTNYPPHFQTACQNVLP